MALWPALLHLLAADVHKGAVSEAANATSALVALQDLLMPEDRPHVHTLELVADLTRRFADFPAFLVNRIPEVAVDLDDCFVDELAAAADINGVWVLPNVIKSGALRQFELLCERVQIDEIDTIPGGKEGEISQEFKSLLALHDLILVEDLLVVRLGQSHCHHFSVSNYCRIAPAVIKLVHNSRFTNSCIGSKDGDGLVAGLETVLIVFEDINSATAAVDDVHAVADFALVHHYRARYKYQYHKQKLVGEDQKKTNVENTYVTRAEQTPHTRACRRECRSNRETCFGRRARGT